MFYITGDISSECQSQSWQGFSDKSILDADAVVACTDCFLVDFDDILPKNTADNSFQYVPGYVSYYKYFTVC